MKTTKYTGHFQTIDGNKWTKSVSCIGTHDAFFLLMAAAIEDGKAPALQYIVDEKGNKTKITGFSLSTEP
jgi:uncharacterized protein YjdB